MPFDKNCNTSNNTLRSRNKPYHKIRRFFSLETLKESEQESELGNTSASISDLYRVEIESASNLESITLNAPIFSNSSIDQNSNNSKMTTSGDANAQIITPSDIFQSLRVPDAIKDLPHFDGNPRLLFEFLNNVEEIRSLISCTEGTPYGQLLLRAIRNKIIGSANEVLNMYGTQLNWTQIKQNLILHYSDKRNETSLIRDLHGIKQQGKTVERFYSEIIEILATMTNHVQIHETDANVIKAKRDLYTEMCLNAFLSGLKEPLGSTIRAMKPDTLAIAFSYCIKEQNISYARYDHSALRGDNKPHVALNRTLPLTRQSPPNTSIPRNNPFAINRPPNQQNFNKPPNQHNFNVNNHTLNSNTPTPFYRSPQNFPFQPQRTVNPYTIQSRQNSFPTRTNNFNLPKPEPMDISSGNTRQSRHPQSNIFRSQPSGNKELFNVTCTSYPNDTDSNYQELDNYYENQYEDQNYGTESIQLEQTGKNNYPSEDSEINTQYEIDDTNFPTGASTSPSDT